MRFDIILALISVIPQSLLVMGAPTNNVDHVSKRNNTILLPPKKRLNLDAYHQAVMNANNLAEHDLNLRLNIQLMSAKNVVTMIHCVGTAADPTRVMVFPDAHHCDQAGWTHYYSFITYVFYNKVSPTPWCIGDAYNPHRAMLLHETNCDKYGWSHITSGFATPEPKGINSFISKSTDNRMFMNPFNQYNSGGFKHDTVVNHQAILIRPTQSMVDYITEHCKNHPTLYKRPSGSHTFSREVLWYGQLMVEALEELNLGNTSSEYYRIRDEAVFNKRVDSAGLKHLHNRVKIEVGGKKKGSDGLFRHQVTMQHITPEGQTQYMGAITVPSQQRVGYQNVRSAFSEALRDHTTVILQLSDDDIWLIAPLYSHGSLPNVYMGWAV
ncbi:hypothetical protein BGZ65_003674 [Modicella reniformis]|uniref:Uncharacterized protein n=1 Tax=Modicella reniformis TaxID=1440133 RepID=A0A9P6M2X3_9FUNG|nr:hypothetical protein BGZ65_003674 [Modicella reniformis]